MSSPVFEVHGPALTQIDNSLFGLWKTHDLGSKAAAVPSGQAFAAGQDDSGGAPPGLTLWRVTVPEKTAVEEISMSPAAYDQAFEQAVVQTRGQIDETVQAAGRLQVAGSYSAVQDMDDESPEKALFAALHAVNHHSMEIGLQPQATSYGLEEVKAFTEKWQELRAAAQQFQAFLEGVTLSVHQFAQVETQAGQDLLGISVVGWSGDARTVWYDRCTPAQTALHYNTLQVTLLTRRTLLQAVTLTMQATAKLALIFANPSSAIWSLPAVWRYTNGAMAKFVDYQQLSKK